MELRKVLMTSRVAYYAARSVRLWAAHCIFKKVNIWHCGHNSPDMLDVTTKTSSSAEQKDWINSSLEPFPTMLAHCAASHTTAGNHNMVMEDGDGNLETGKKTP